MKRLVLLLVLAACTKAALPTGEATACLSPQERGLVGQQLAIARAVMPAGTRFIPPDGVITMDFRADRHNAEYDANGVVTRVFCG
ncbi:MAG: hypothetical protein KDK24_08565 [Pseudooceanicola sp.]|nr:hypothetical protein [Pseudooceanicola sp.]